MTKTAMKKSYLTRNLSLTTASSRSKSTRHENDMHIVTCKKRKKERKKGCLKEHLPPTDMQSLAKMNISFLRGCELSECSIKTTSTFCSGCAGNYIVEIKYTNNNRYQVKSSVDSACNQLHSIIVPNGV